ncbi:MAG: DUF3054 domain-containing protein, partial [Chloroflexota bacterium]|nr:DUF3054 domain-containing protein [Chloroflexota bacterium]
WRRTQTPIPFRQETQTIRQSFFTVRGRGDVLIPRTPLTAISLIGDTTLLLLFAAIGRANHGDQAGGAVLGVLGTAAPFLIGWYVSGALLGAFSPTAFVTAKTNVLRTATAWLTAGVVGLLLRSAIEHHLTPLAFVIIALGFNLVTLTGWRLLLTVYHPRKSRL